MDNLEAYATQAKTWLQRRSVLGHNPVNVILVQANLFFLIASNLARKDVEMQNYWGLRDGYELTLRLGKHSWLLRKDKHDWWL